MNKRIKLPARGKSCLHIACFDLRNYVFFNQKNRGSHLAWQCPICKKEALLDDLKIDNYVFEILFKTKEVKATFVMIEYNGDW